MLINFYYRRCVEILTILLAILIFGALIFIHEFGHYISARIFQVTIKEFAVGMGPRILSHTSAKTSIIYSLRLFPIGGFVTMEGEDEESEDDHSLNKKPVWQKLIITASGATMNFIIGIVIMCIIVIMAKNIGSTTIFRFVNENSSTELSGLQIGDEITKIGGSRVHIANDLVYEVMREATSPIDVTLIRGGKTITVPDVVFPTIISKGIAFGSVDFYVMSVEKTPLNIIKHSFYQSISSVKLIWQSLIDLVTGKYGVDELSGPVGVTTAIGEAAQEGTSNVLYLVALISLNLGMFNLLPLPALDGGRIIFNIIELIRGKPVDPKLEGYVHFVGIVLLMLLMVFITYKDIVKLFAK